jgi:hypothetical protein
MGQAEEQLVSDRPKKETYNRFMQLLQAVFLMDRDFEAVY